MKETAPRGAIWNAIAVETVFNFELDTICVTIKTHVCALYVHELDTLFISINKT